MPSHQHFRCSQSRKILQTRGERGSYSRFTPEEQQLLRSGHLRLIDYYSRWVRLRRGIVGDTSLKMDKRDRGDAAAVGLDGSETPSIFSIEAATKKLAQTQTRLTGGGLHTLHTTYQSSAVLPYCSLCSHFVATL